MQNQTKPSSSNPEHPKTDHPLSRLPLNNQETVEGDLSFSSNRFKIGLGLAVIGYLIFLLGARPSLFGLDRSPVVGFVQISVFLIGLGIISLGSYMTLDSLWPDGKKTIAAQIGSRLISTGYVICIFTGMADIFGLGSHPLPNVFFGPLQARGVALGMMTIAVGFVLMVRFKRRTNGHENQANLNKFADSAEKNTSSGGFGKHHIDIKSLFQ